MTDPASIGWAARLVSKLPSFRGIANWFYVSANWGRISDDFEQYRRQIKDREEWAARSLAQQAELHELALQRTTVELSGWQQLAEQISQQRDTATTRLEQAVDGLQQARSIIEARNNAWADCVMLLAVLLQSESQASRQILCQYLDESTRTGVELVIARIAQLPPPGGTPPGMLPRFPP